jgi:hypothetical protein
MVPAGEFAQHNSDVVAEAREAMAVAQQHHNDAADLNRCQMTDSVGDLVVLREDTLTFKPWFTKAHA